MSRDCLKAYLLVFMPLDIADGNMYVECQQWHFEFYALLPYEIFTFFLLFESQVLYFSFILRLMMILSLVIFQLPPQIDDTWRWRREQANLADFCTFWNFHTIMWRERGIWMVCVCMWYMGKRELGKAAIFHQPTISHLESSNSIVVVVKAAATTNTVVVEVPTTPFKRQANSLSKLI